MNIKRRAADAAWWLLAQILSSPFIVDAVIAYAKRTPYFHITARGNPDDIYMGRWWFFNPYGKDAAGDQTPARWPWLPSVRVHEILRADDDDHEHNHPWPARTIVLAGWYSEQRRDEFGDHAEVTRTPGYTGRITRDTYHRITDVSSTSELATYLQADCDHEVCTTLFFTWGESQGWGFKVNGKHVPWREHLKVEG